MIDKIISLFSYPNLAEIQQEDISTGWHLDQVKWSQEANVFSMPR
jgi:hypothetical protein